MADIDQSIEAIGQILGDATDEIGDNVVKAAKEVVTNTGKEVASNVGGAVADAGKNAIAEGAKTVAENVTSNTGNAAENILKGVEEVVSDNKNIVRNPIKKISRREAKKQAAKLAEDKAAQKELRETLTSSLNSHISTANSPTIYQGLGKEGEDLIRETLDEAGSNTKLFLDNGSAGADEYKRAIDSISEKNSVGESKVFDSHYDKVMEDVLAQKHELKNPHIETIGSEETMNSALDLMQDEIDNQPYFVNRKNADKVSKAVDQVENKGQILVREAEKQVDDARLVARREGFTNMTARDFKRESKKSPEGYLRNLRYQEGVTAKSIAGTDKAADNKLIKEIAKNKEIDPLKVDKNMIDDYNLNRIANASEKDMNFFNYMGYYRVPQIATGIGGTAWLVNNLASRRGRQTNAELYGQQPMR